MTVLGDIVVGQVLERAAFLVGVESPDVVHEVAAVVVDGNALDGAESVFFAGFEVVDLLLVCGDDVADDLVVQDGDVRHPFLRGLVVTEVDVDGKVLGLVDGKARKRIFVIADGMQDVRRDGDFFVVVRVVDDEEDVGFAFVFAGDGHAGGEFSFFALLEGQKRISVDAGRDIEKQLGFRRVENLPVEQ